MLILFILSIPVNFSPLKVQLEGELDDARAGAGLCDAAEGRGHRDVAVRVGEVRPVEDVEELRAELAAHGLRERQVLDDGEVNVLLARPRQDVAPRIAERRARVEEPAR